jgi:hypothetical protein
MRFLIATLPILAFAMAILMTGILMIRMPKESLRSAFTEGLFWDIGLLLGISIEMLILENL